VATAESLIEHYTNNTSPGRYYDDGSTIPEIGGDPAVRLIAFYLPQFHAIPENDNWWGPGFTEWTNVTKALPRFAGHYQPRLPGALGFYDLQHTDTLRRQAELAKLYGVHGFCFMHYWFGGHRLLERPLDNLLANPDIDLPFFVYWANENWTRRWVDANQDVLIAQNHSPEDDLAFARSLEPFFDDPRYIRIGDRPLLMLYRPSLFPDVAATIERWREYFARQGRPDPYLLMIQSSGQVDPRGYGFDAAVGYPPQRGVDHLTPVSAPMLLDRGFRGTLRRYEDLASEFLSHHPTEYQYFPGVTPQWDNEARRPGKGQVFVGSTPELYSEWLEAECRWVAGRPRDERLVFINAWNEWAEGAYLEPDQHYGHAYLAATARALGRLADPPRKSGARALDGYAVRNETLFRRGVRIAGNQAAKVLEGAARGLRSL
jgi:lipopolysaccharide biosynthesis protein